MAGVAAGWEIDSDVDFTALSSEVPVSAPPIGLSLWAYGQHRKLLTRRDQLRGLAGSGKEESGPGVFGGGCWAPPMTAAAV